MKSLRKAKTRWVWCSTQPKHIDWLGWNTGRSKAKKAPKRVKCPDCGLRFLSRVRECHDAGCMHLYVPAHKKKEKVTSS